MATYYVDTNHVDASPTKNMTVTIGEGATYTLDVEPHRWNGNTDFYIGTVAANHGTFFIDATAIRDLAYTGATGGPLAYREVVTGATSGASGEVIYDDLTGTIKFRSITSGPFQDAESISGSGTWAATASGADVVGGMEVLINTFTLQVAAIPKTRAVDYALGIGDASSGQTFTHFSEWSVPRIEVETGSATDVYEVWTCVNSLSRWGAGETGKVYTKAYGSKTITVGDGTNGNTVPTGARVRCNNLIIGDPTATGTTAEQYGATLTIANTTTVDIQKTDFSRRVTFGPGSVGMSSFTFLDCSLTGSFQTLALRHNLTFDNLTFSFSLWNTGITCFAPASSGLRESVPVLSFNDPRWTFDDTNSYRCLTDANQITINGGAILGAIYDGMNATHSRVIYPRYGSNYTIVGTKIMGPVNCVPSATSETISFTDIEWGLLPENAATYTGTTFPAFAFSNQPVLIDGLTQLQGTVNEMTLSTSPFINGSQAGLTFRNIGTFSTPISLPGFDQVLNLSASSDVTMHNCHFSDVQTSYADNIYAGVSFNVDIVNSSYSGAGRFWPNGDNVKAKQLAGISQTAGDALDFHDYGSYTGSILFLTSPPLDVDTTTAMLRIMMQPPTSGDTTSITASRDVYSFKWVNGTLTMLPGDWMIWTWPYRILTATAFDDVIEPLLRQSGTSPGTLGTNITFDYDIDHGSGFTETWKDLTAANLGAEVWDVEDDGGPIIKVRATCATKANIQQIALPLKTTAAKLALLYPDPTMPVSADYLKTINLTFDALDPQPITPLYVWQDEGPIKVVVTIPSAPAPFAATDTVRLLLKRTGQSVVELDGTLVDEPTGRTFYVVWPKAQFTSPGLEWTAQPEIIYSSDVEFRGKSILSLSVQGSLRH